MSADRRNIQLQNRVLMKRYWKLRMRKASGSVARFIMRRVFPFKERKRERILASTLAEYAKQTAKSRRHGFESNSVLLNLGLFFLIADRDIQAVKLDALTHPDPWKRSLYARVILLTIHELDMDKVAGNKLRQSLADAGIPEDAKRKITEALRMVRSAQQKAQKQFAFLRNATIAHRDADALLQYRAIAEIDSMAVLGIASEFYDGTRLFLSVFPDTMVQVGSFPGLLNQVRARESRKN